MEKQGTPIGPLDTLIAAHALSLNVTLVTNNTKEFKRVVGLKLVDWLER
ncbi:PIN domain-containing protein [Acinetobacter baumannii]